MKSSPFWVISAGNRTSIYFWAVIHIWTSGTTLDFIFHFCLLLIYFVLLDLVVFSSYVLFYLQGFIRKSFTQRESHNKLMSSRRPSFRRRSSWIIVWIIGKEERAVTMLQTNFLNAWALQWILALIHVRIIAMHIMWSRSKKRPFQSCATQDDHSLLFWVIFFDFFLFCVFLSFSCLFFSSAVVTFVECFSLFPSLCLLLFHGLCECNQLQAV